MEQSKYQLNGWPSSPYTTKVAAYLGLKGIPYVIHSPSAWYLFGKVKRSVGQVVMPTVECPDGGWLQDSSEIIDVLEKRFDSPAIHPTDPVLRLASYLIEFYADEWLIHMALYFRWTRPANVKFIVNDFGQCSFPWVPEPIRRPLTQRLFADRMRRYLPMFGIDTTGAGIEHSTLKMLEELNEHFTEQPFLFGAKPSLADVSLFGPLQAHLYRDPETQDLFGPYEALKDWMRRFQDGQPFKKQQNRRPDPVEVPETLDPIFSRMFNEQFPFALKVNDAIDEFCASNPHADRVPRALGFADYTYGGVSGKRKLTTFMQWKMQRPLACYQALRASEKDRADQWLKRVAGRAAIQTEIKNPQKRENYQCILGSTAR